MAKSPVILNQTGFAAPLPASRFKPTGAPLTSEAGLSLYSSGAFLNTPSGTTGYLAVNGSGIAAWSATAFQVSQALDLASGQVKFPAAQNASADANTLDDYEEGTWTPAWVSTGATFTYDSRYGVYTKVGNKVTFSAWIDTATATGTLTNTLSMSGLPFTSNGATNNYSACSVVGQVITSPGGMAFVVSNSASVATRTATGADGTPNHFDLASGRWHVVSGTYFI